MSISDKLKTIAENMTKVHDAGKTAEYDKMWNRIQGNGNLTDYSTMAGYFNGKMFGFNNFYPKYDIRPVGNANQLFYAWENQSKFGITDNKGSLTQRLKDCGVVLDTSQATSLLSAFNYGHFTEIPTIDCTGITTPANTTSVFANGYSRLVTIEKIKTKEEVTYKNWFQNTNVQNVVFEGVIGQDLDISYGTRLTYDSVMSIVEHLKDYSGTTTTKTLTLKSGVFTNASFKTAGVTEADIEALVNAKGWSLVS